MPEYLPPGHKVLTFSANTYLALEKADNFPSRALTIYCWVSWINPDDRDPAFESGAAPSPDTATLMNFNEQEGSDHHRLWIVNLKNIAVWWGGSSTGGTGIQVADGDWHHLAVTMRPKDATHYTVQVIKNAGEADQQLVERTITHDPGNTLRRGGPLVLGQRYWGGNFEFSGQLAGFAIWNHVRSLEQIARDKNRLLADGESGLAINWPLDARPPKVTAGALTFEDTAGDDMGINF